MHSDVALDETKGHLRGRYFGSNASLSWHETSGVFLFECVFGKNHEFGISAIFLTDGVELRDRVLTACHQTKRKVSKRRFFQIVVTAQKRAETDVKRV